MLILAGVSLNAIVGDNGIITNAQMASVMSRFASYKEELEVNALDDTGIYASGEKIKQYIPSMEERDIDKFVIIKSELLYIASDENELKAAQSLKLGGVSGEASDSGAAIKEIQNIIGGVVELSSTYTDKVPTDDSQLLNEPEHKNNSEGLVGTRLFDRSGLNLTNKTWNILIEYDRDNNEVARYGSGYYWLKKGETYVINGESLTFKNDYVVNYSSNEYAVLSGRAVNWNENATLAVTDGLAMNVDSISLSDGEWINNATGKTYEQELATADAISDEETRVAELATVRNTFYNFYITNSITGTKTDTGTQKIGDVEYDQTTKALKFNEDSTNNPTGEDGYLRLLKSGLDFRNGFTFEYYGKLSRLAYVDGSKYVTNNSYDDGKFVGLFSRDYELFGGTWQDMRLGLDKNGSIWADFCDIWEWTGEGYNLQTKGDGNICGIDGAPKLVEKDKDFYLTFVYTVYDKNISNPEYTDYMKENGTLDKVTVYLNGELYGYTYYSHDAYSTGVEVWNNDYYQFMIGAMKMGSKDNVRFLKGLSYSTRLYQISLTPEQVKANYDMTLRYRSSF